MEPVKSAMPDTLPGPSLRQYSTVLKMGAIAILGLLLLIPLAMVRSVLTERLARRNDTIREITSTWGNAQDIFGPVLIVPYKYTERALKDRLVNGRLERVEVEEILRARAFFLPATFKAEGTLVPTRLHRGIYEAAVYDGTLKISGSFARPSFEEWKVDPQQVLWEEAELVVCVTDLRGTKESLAITLGDNVIPLKPGARLEGFANGVYARINGPALQTAAVPYQVTLSIKGSHSLRFAPVGVNNDLQLSSTWPDPGFQGAFLPAERKLGPEGFQAHWQVSHYGRAYPQQWTEKNPITKDAISESLFGVALVSVVDSYRYVERSIKYAILFIALMFTALFLFEILAGVRIHPFQYTLVGVALCLFYLALLALSEVLSFSAAYWIGAAAATLMISLYSIKVLHGGRRTGVIALGLPAMYAFLFVILRLQDYSLLIGTSGLFLVLALVMYLTRNVNWYARDHA
jgi:inner membrane protein